MLLPPSSTVRETSSREPFPMPCVHQERSYSPPRGEATPVSRPELTERRSHLPSGSLFIPAKTMSFSYHRVRFPVMQWASRFGEFMRKFFAQHVIAAVHI